MPLHWRVQLCQCLWQKDVSCFILLFGESPEVRNCSGQSFFQQLLRAVDFSSSRLLYNYQAVHCDVSFPVFTHCNECLLSCIKGTVEDSESVMSFECGHDFIVEWLCEWGGCVWPSTWIFRWVSPRFFGSPRAF